MKQGVTTYSSMFLGIILRLIIDNQIYANYLI